MDAMQKAALGLDILDGLADKWAADVDITSMIKNVTSPMNLNRNAPADVREKFKARMEAQISAIVLQAFVEGALRGVDLVSSRKKTTALLRYTAQPRTTGLSLRSGHAPERPFGASLDRRHRRNGWTKHACSLTANFFTLKATFRARNKNQLSWNRRPER